MGGGLSSGDKCATLPAGAEVSRKKIGVSNRVGSVRKKELVFPTGLEAPVAAGAFFLGAGGVGEDFYQLSNFNYGFVFFNRIRVCLHSLTPYL
jgi:hypothetical protein